MGKEAKNPFSDNSNNPWPPSMQKRFAETGRKMREAMDDRVFAALVRKWGAEEVAGWTQLGARRLDADST